MKTAVAQRMLTAIGFAHAAALLVRKDGSRAVSERSARN